MGTKRTKWSKDMVIAKIKERLTTGNHLNYSSVVAEDEALTGAARRLFGSWSKAVAEAGLDYERIKRETRCRSERLDGYWTEEAIIQQIRELHDSGITLSPHSVQKQYSKLYSAAVFHFKSWGKAVEGAGIDYLEHRKTRDWTPEKIIKQIQYAHERGADLSDNTVNVLAAALYGAASTHFGCWEQAVEAAGISYAKIIRTVRWSKQKMIEIVKEEARIGKPLTTTNFNRGFVNAAVKVFGSWGNLLAEAGLGEKPWREIDKRIVNNIRKYRAKLGISTVELGRRIGVSHRTISMLELSQRIDPRVSFALKLARELNCEVEELFELPDEE